MDAASVRDIGTSFTVQKRNDSIKVQVYSGKVSFIKNKTGESKELSANDSLYYSITADRFGEINPNSQANHQSSLRFNNSPLSDVIAVLQKVSGNKIQLYDTIIGQRRFTANLEGESFENALKVICASLNLDYARKNGLYILKNKDITGGK
jgi:transmembrane sensor